MSIDSVQQNERLDTIENSIKQIAGALEGIDDEFEDIDDTLKDLKATDDIIKSDLTRKSFANSLDADLNHLKWGASSRWSSSLYYSMRNSDQMTI